MLAQGSAQLNKDDTVRIPEGSPKVNVEDKFLI